MSETSRRKLLAGAGAAGAGAVVVGLGGEASAATPARSRESVLAWVEDPRTGEVHVMSGEEQSVVHDHELVARILRAGGK